jgi:WD40 repeat protein
MSNEANDRADREERLKEVLVACLEAIDAGQPLDAEEWLACYPEFADELARLIDGQLHLGRLIAPAAATPRQADDHDDDATPSPRWRGPGVNPGDGRTRAVAAGRTQIFGNYELLRELGHGGMGTVYEARQPSLQRTVALKMLRTGWVLSSADLQRFKAEAEAVAALDHRHIVPIYEVGELEGQAYFTMKLVSGGSLDHHLRQFSADGRASARLLVRVARAVHHAHQRGLLHRDLKPSNILVSPPAPGENQVEPGDFEPYVTDFGLAKRLASPGPASSAPASPGCQRGVSDLTQSGAIVGTPGYMAPEQATGRKGSATTAADIYSLGAVLYALLTERAPFTGDTPLQILAQVTDREPAAPSKTNPRVHRDLEAICLKCLDKEPRRRYPSAEALAEDLERWLNGEPIQAHLVGRVVRLGLWCRRNPALAIVGGLAGAAVLGLLAFAIGFALQQAGAAREIRQAQNKTLEALRQEKRTSSDRSRDLGLTLCEQGEVASGMLWLARALQTAPEETGDAAHAIRLNLAAWRPRLRTLRAILPNRNLATEDPTITDLAYSPDGATIAGLSAKTGIVLLWDTATGRLRGEPLRHGEMKTVMAFHPDGSLITGCYDHRIRFWDVSTGELLREPVDTNKVIGSLAISRDGRRLSTQQGDGTEIGVWDIGPGRSLSLKEKVSLVEKVSALSHNYAFFVTWNDDSTRIQVFATATGQPVGPSMVDLGGIRSAVLSPDGKTVVSTGKMGGALAWDAATGKRRFDLSHPGPVNRVVFSPNGQTILTAGADSTGRLWDAATGRPLGSPIHLPTSVWGAAFGPEDAITFATSGGKGQSVLVWDTVLNGDRILQTPHPISTICFTPDGRTLLTGGARVKNLLDVAWQFALNPRKTAPLFECEARFWDAATNAPRRNPLVHSQPILSAAFSPDGAQCLIGSAHWEAPDGEASLWESATGRKISSPALGKNVGVVAVAFSLDGRSYLTGGQDGQAHVWDAATGKCLRTFTHQTTVRGVAYKPPDGRSILTGSDDGTAQLWDAETGEKLGEPLRHPAPVSSVVFSPDGNYLLTGCQDNKARLWDVEDPKVLRSLVHRGWVLAVAFSPDGNLILTGSTDGTARLWDRATGLPVGPPVQHEKAPIPGAELNWVPAVTFSPDGRTSVTGGLDQKARFRPLPRPVEGTPEQIMTWVEFITGMTLDDVVRFLDADEWQERRQRLEALGGLEKIEQHETLLRK